jgi:hypothetical protein
MPRGRISFGWFGPSGNHAGECDLGNCLAFDLTPKFQFKDHLTSRGPFNVLDAAYISQMEYEVKITPEERSRENMALFFLGDPDGQKSTNGLAVITQAGVTHPDVSYTPRLDRWVDLGYRMIKSGSISITATGAVTTAIDDTTASDNYRVDLETGRLMIRSGNDLSITDAQSGVTVTFKCGAVVTPKFTQGTEPVTGFLRYIGMSAVGPRHQVKLWKVQLNPDSAIKMLDPANYAGLSFTGKVYIDDDNGLHPDFPFGEITEIVAATAYPS